MNCLFGHRWDGCKCKRCGRTREKKHDWNGCVCRRCGRKRDKDHDWDGCVCRRCGKKQDKSTTGTAASAGAAANANFPMTKGISGTAACAPYAVPAGIKATTWRIAYAGAAAAQSMNGRRSAGSSSWIRSMPATLRRAMIITAGRTPRMSVGIRSHTGVPYAGKKKRKKRIHSFAKTRCPYSSGTR